jgi:dienelactone hydrolase
MPDAFDPLEWGQTLLDRHERRYVYDGQSGTALEEWQSAFRAALVETLGLPVIEAESAGESNAQRESVEQRDGHERQRWSLETERDFRVPFYLLLPDDAEAPYPVVLAIHGHGTTGKELYVGEYDTEEERRKIVEGDRDVGVQAVERGYATIVPDMRGFAELADPDDVAAGDWSCRELQLHAQMVGRTLVGDRVWDVQRLIDFAEDHDELDVDRIAITGNSGGGTVSLFAAAVDERIDVAAPASYFCTFRDSIYAMHHCECNYVPGLLRLGGMADVAGLVAPRPFLAIHGAEDEIYPVEGTRENFERLQTIYQAAGVPDRCELYVGDEGHRYYADGAWPFIERHL